jgi:hypothetical protein
MNFESVNCFCLLVGYDIKLFSDIFVTLQQDTIKAAKWSGAAEMTEEQALAEQQRMFAEARARMNGGTISSNQPDADQSLEN